MRCPDCKIKLSPDRSTCSICGKKVKNSRGSAFLAIFLSLFFSGITIVSYLISHGSIKTIIELINEHSDLSVLIPALIIFACFTGRSLALTCQIAVLVIGASRLKKKDFSLETRRVWKGAIFLSGLGILTIIIGGIVWLFFLISSIY